MDATPLVKEAISKAPVPALFVVAVMLGFYLHVGAMAAMEISHSESLQTMETQHAADLFEVWKSIRDINLDLGNEIRKQAQIIGLAACETEECRMKMLDNFGDITNLRRQSDVLDTMRGDR